MISAQVEAKFKQLFSLGNLQNMYSTELTEESECKYWYNLVVDNQCIPTIFKQQSLPGKKMVSDSNLLCFKEFKGISDSQSTGIDFRWSHACPWTIGWIGLQ